jgi:hypothetical protein
MRVKNAHATSPGFAGGGHSERCVGTSSLGEAGEGGSRSETEGAAGGGEAQRDVFAACDALDVAEDELVRIEPEALLQDEAVVHGLRRARADAVGVGNLGVELEVGVIVEGAAGEDMAGGEGEDLVAIPFEFAQASPVILPVFWEDLSPLHAGDRGDEIGDPRDKCFERREPWGFALSWLREGGRVLHARSICSGPAGVGNALSKCRLLES